MKMGASARSKGWVALASIIATTACSCKKAPTTEVIVGVQSDPMGGVVSALHIVVKIAGKVVDDETMKPPRGSRVGFPQPWEKTFSGAGNENAPIEIQVDAIGDPNAKDPLFTRLASTHFVAGKSELLRVPLEARCIVYPVIARGESKIPGPLSGPKCAAPGTCIAGVCQSSAVPPAALESYTSDWPTNAPDRCKQKNGGPPALQVGTGQAYYLPMTPGQTLQAEAGPQGGHHIWIATRMKNMKQAGSLTKIVGIQPGTNTTIPATTLAFTYAPDEGDFCKLYGIRYQLDNEGIDYKQFLGKPLDVVVTVSDSAGASTTTTAHVNIAPTLLNP